MGASAVVTLPGDAEECGEGRSFNPRVVGSSPTGPTNLNGVIGGLWSPPGAASKRRSKRLAGSIGMAVAFC